LIVRSKGEHFLVVVPAHRQVDTKKLRKAAGFKSLSMISEGDLFELFKLRKGAVPPFGSVLGIKTYADASLKDQEEIVFNAGLKTRSVFIKSSDYEKIENPTWLENVVKEIAE
jgi:prolyl-tRNA editing enzyme YbaK/EbsC (Cys-tRNA(Pro) deacylase)